MGEGRNDVAVIVKGQHKPHLESFCVLTVMVVTQILKC